MGSGAASGDGVRQRSEYLAEYPRALLVRVTPTRRKGVVDPQVLQQIARLRAVMMTIRSLAKRRDEWPATTPPARACPRGTPGSRPCAVCTSGLDRSSLQRYRG